MQRRRACGGGRRYPFAVSTSHPSTVPPALLSLRGSSRLSWVVHDQIKERLLEGRYSGGERLSVEALRKEWGISKQPVMEALRRLSGDGLVDIIPQVGCQVTTYSPREVEDFFVMFGGFEGTISGIAALRRTDAQLAELDRSSEKIGRLCEAIDPVERSHGYRVLNRRFHTTIHAMAHSRVMAETSARMWDLSDFLINTTGRQQPLSSALEQRHDDHERIRAALHAGDQQAARREMEQHIVEIVGSVIHFEQQRSES